MPIAARVSRDRALPSYRIYYVGPGGRLRVGEAFSADDDHHAVASARRHIQRGQSAELWEWGRPVGRFTRDDAFIPDGD